MKRAKKYTIFLIKENCKLEDMRFAPTKYRAYFIGIIWKYFPDLTYKNRDYVVMKTESIIINKIN